MTTVSGRSPDGSGYSAEPEPCSTVSAVPVSIPNAGLPEDFEPWMAEGLAIPVYCPRGLSDCTSLAQIVAHGHQSFVCVGENDGTRRQFKQDRFRVCFKNDAEDDICDYDKRDLMQTQAVMAMALAVVAEREDCEQPEASAIETRQGEDAQQASSQSDESAVAESQTPNSGHPNE